MYSNRYVFVIIVEVIILLLLLYIYSYKKTIKEHHTDHSEAANPNVKFHKRNCAVYPVVKYGSTHPTLAGNQIPMGVVCNNTTSCDTGTYKKELQQATWTPTAAEAAAGKTKESMAGENYDTVAQREADEAASAALNESQRRDIGIAANGNYAFSLDSGDKVISIDCIPPAPTGQIIHEHFQSYGKNIEFFNNNRVEHFEDVVAAPDEKVKFYFAVHADHKSSLVSFIVKVNITPNGTWKTTPMANGSIPLSVSKLSSTNAMSAVTGGGAAGSAVSNPMLVPTITSGATPLQLSIRVFPIEQTAGGAAARALGNPVIAAYKPAKLRFEIWQPTANKSVSVFKINHKSISMTVEPTFAGNTQWDAATAAGHATMSKFYNNVKPSVIAIEPPASVDTTTKLTAFEASIKCATIGGGALCIDNTYKYIAQPDDDSPLTLWDTHINTPSLYHNKDIKSHTIGLNAPYMLLNAPSATAVNALYTTHLNGSSSVLTQIGLSKAAAAKELGNYWKRLRDNDDKANFFKELVPGTDSVKKTAVTKLITALYAYLTEQKDYVLASRDDGGKIADGVHAILKWIPVNSNLLGTGIYDNVVTSSLGTADAWEAGKFSNSDIAF